MKKKFFITDQNIYLPVSEKKYLLPFLTKTTKGTKYYQVTKYNRIKKEYYAEKLIQFHQFIEIFESLGLNLKKKSLIDIGTGNAIIPKILLITKIIKTALGTDLYSPFEHSSARIPLENDIFVKFLKYFKIKVKKNKISYNSYYKDIKQTAEKEIFKPKDILLENLNLNNLKKYKFIKLGAQDLNKINKKFDIIYCKGIEHIHNLKIVVKNFSIISKKNSYIYLKIRPFHSYLGPHRFATSAIPWGHVLLTEKEFKRYTYEFHKPRFREMLKNYYDTLSMPRYSVDELVRFFEKAGFNLVCQKTETPPYIKKIVKFKNEIKDFDKLMKKRGATNLDLISSVHHLVLQKN
jgi:hypothetical protein